MIQFWVVVVAVVGEVKELGEKMAGSSSIIECLYDPIAFMCVPGDNHDDGNNGEVEGVHLQERHQNEYIVQCV